MVLLKADCPPAQAQLPRLALPHGGGLGALREGTPRARGLWDSLAPWAPGPSRAVLTGGQRDPSSRPQVAVSTRYQGQEGGLHPPLTEASEVGWWWAWGSGFGRTTSLCTDPAPHSREGSLSSELGSVPLGVAIESALGTNSNQDPVHLASSSS